MSLSSALAVFVFPFTRNRALARIITLAASPPPDAHLLVC